MPPYCRSFAMKIDKLLHLVPWHQVTELVEHQSLRKTNMKILPKKKKEKLKMSKLGVMENSLSSYTCYKTSTHQSTTWLLVRLIKAGQMMDNQRNMESIWTLKPDSSKLSYKSLVSTRQKTPKTLANDLLYWGIHHITLHDYILVCFA